VGSNRRVMFGSTDGKGLKTSPRGRFCRVEGCATVLSIYNSATGSRRGKPIVQSRLTVTG